MSAAEPKRARMNALTPKAVNALMCACLYTDDELQGHDRTKGPPKEAIVVQGITSNFGLHPDRVEAVKPKVRQLLEEVPKIFFDRESVPDAFTPGGASFLTLVMDKHDRQWGEHTDAEGLLILAMACNVGRYCIQRQMWPDLPGGMPYVVFTKRPAGMPPPIVHGVNDAAPATTLCNLDFKAMLRLCLHEYHKWVSGREGITCPVCRLVRSHDS